SYAHVPWKSKGQRRYTDEDVPVAEEKLQMYQTGSAYLHQLGFSHIGMDHFALPTDALMLAYQVGKLHRNFMGYTTTNHKLVIGLGASAISDTWDAFAQNEKGVEAYQDAIASGRLPIINGHNLNETDQLIRKHILDLMCRDTTTLVEEQLPAGTFDAIMERLSGFVEDGLISIEGGKISILPSGRLFIRNICSAIDLHLHSGSRQGNTFSKAI
ncbi:MAG TPA: coproporphyrinogen III oxidase, partial [Chitinophagales bacterium]|nr:coproporphyrinogen III oxidase [Chitinophagales bacterium]